MLLSTRRLAKQNATNSAAVGTLTPMRILASLAGVGLGAALCGTTPAAPPR